MLRILLTALTASFVLSACSSDETENYQAAWATQRAKAAPLQDATLKVSFGDETRPILTEPRVDLSLPATTEGFLEFAVSSRKHAELGTWQVRFFHEGGHEDRPANVQSSISPWIHLRVDCQDLPATRGFEVMVDGQPADASRGWAVSVPTICRQRDSGQRPNVLLITVDTLRADYLGCYGHDRDTSPALDQLASESVLFERALSQGSWTLPSYASVFSGLYPESHGVIHRNHRFGSHFVSFVESFASAGYSTGAVVSGTFTDAEWGFDQGFDSYDDLGMVTPDGGPRIEDPSNPAAMNDAAKRITSPLVTDKAIDWLKRNRERRFFFTVHYFDPHSDLLPHAGITERFPVRPATKRMDLNGQPIPQNTDRARSLYEGEIAFTDQHIGRLLDSLKELGLSKDTVVVLCADHGEELFERAKLGHGHGLFNELVHVPLLFRVPGLAAFRSDTPVANVDIGPTLLDLCGIDYAEPSIGGRSLAAILRQRETDRGEPVLSARFPTVAPPNMPAAPRDWHRVDHEQWSYIRYYGRGRPLEFLFDGNQDPYQLKNLAGEQAAAMEPIRAFHQRAQGTLRQLAPKQVDETRDLSDDEMQTLRGLGYVGDEDDDVMAPPAEQEQGERPQ